MIRTLLLASAATAAVLLLVRKAPRPLPTMGQTRPAKPRPVPATDAAERLRQAWGDYHTVA